MLVSAAPAAAATNVAGVVDSGNTPLNVPVKAGTASSVVGSLPNGSRVTLVCQEKGPEVIGGRIRTTNMWNKLTNGRYIADA
jgi:flagellar protein FlgJ